MEPENIETCGEPLRQNERENYANDSTSVNRKISLFLLTALPVAVTFSSSVTIALTYVIMVLWLLDGHWRERRSLIRSSSILLASIPLILWTFFGVFRCENIPDAVRYWFGHYPYLFILVAATLLTKTKDRYAIFSSMNFGMFLCLLWMLAFNWYYADLDFLDRHAKRVTSIYLYRNTICLGVAVTLWGGLWCFFPYTSRFVPGFRRFLPERLLHAMDQAAGTSLLKLPRLLSTGNGPAITLSLLRWGVVAFSFVFVVYINPSRTALVGCMIAYIFVLIRWNVKWGVIMSLLLLLSVFVALGILKSQNMSLYQPILAHRHSLENAEWQHIHEVMSGQMTLDEFSRTEITRPGTYLLTINEILKKPLLGWGMAEGRRLVFSKTGYVDPHNEFLYITLQHGIVGLALFVFWMLSLFVPAFRNNSVWQHFGLFVATIVLFDCLFNNAMSYHRETMLLCLAIALSGVSEGNAVETTPLPDRSQKTT